MSSQKSDGEKMSCGQAERVADEAVEERLQYFEDYKKNRLEAANVSNPSQIIRTPIGPYPPASVGGRRRVLMVCAEAIGRYEDTSEKELKVTITFPDGTSHEWDHASEAFHLVRSTSPLTINQAACSTVGNGAGNA